MIGVVVVNESILILFQDTSSHSHMSRCLDSDGKGVYFVASPRFSVTTTRMF